MGSVARPFLTHETKFSIGFLTNRTCISDYRRQADSGVFPVMDIITSRGTTWENGLGERGKRSVDEWGVGFERC